MDNFDLRKFLAEGKLYENTEALSREEVVDMAQKIADEFSYEDAQEGGSSMVYMVGNVDGMRFELDTKATNRTPADDAKYGTGEGWGGSFRIDVKPNGYEIRNTEKGGLVATMDMENGFRMLSAAESRAEMGLEEGEMDNFEAKLPQDIEAMAEKLGGYWLYNGSLDGHFLNSEDKEKSRERDIFQGLSIAYFADEDLLNIMDPISGETLSKERDPKRAIEVIRQNAMGLEEEYNTDPNLQMYIDNEEFERENAKMEEGKMLDEGWKETLVGIGMTAASIAGIGKAMAPSPEALADKEQAELVVNAQQDALEKSSDEEVNQMVNSLEDAGIQIMGTYIKIPPSMYDKYRDNPQELNKIINQEQRKVLQKLMVKGNDMVKSGFIITSNGALQWANPSQITPINEEKENKPSNKMKKSELKEMIRAAMLAETSVEETLVDADQDMADAILNALGGEAAFEAVVRAMSTDDAQTYLGAIMRDHDIEMGPVGDIPGFEGTMDALDSLSLREEEEDEDVEAEIEADVDVDVDTDMDMDMGSETDGIDVKQDADTDLGGTVGDVQDNLEAALEAARELGDEKLEDQIGNTLTFFTRTHVVK